MSHAHGYVADASRRNTWFAFGVLGLGFGIALGELQAALGCSLPSWIDAPGAFGFAAFCLVLWDRRLWRVRYFRWSSNVTPILNGKWRAELRSSYHEHESVITGAVTIQQSWSTIAIYFEAAQSKSCSVSASLVQGAVGWELIYHYDNLPDPDAPASMQRHNGTAWLRFSTDLASAEGHYFTGRGRLTQGSLRLTRV